LLARTLTVVRRDRPQWLVEQSQAAIDPDAPAVDAVAQLVVQQDRRDGAELLTVRYPLAERGALRAYAGAGLNRAVYFGGEDGEPTMLTRRNRQSSLGAAAEVGAELQLSRQLMVSADLRWADLDDDAVLLRADDGYVGADAVAVGVSVGWRFR
jgi:outer membrane protein W